MRQALSHLKYSWETKGLEQLPETLWWGSTIIHWVLLLLAKNCFKSGKYRKDRPVWVSYFADEKTAFPEPVICPGMASCSEAWLGPGARRPRPLLLLSPHMASWASARPFQNLTVGHSLHSFYITFCHLGPIIPACQDHFLSSVI